MATIIRGDDDFDTTPAGLGKIIQIVGGVPTSYTRLQTSSSTFVDTDISGSITPTSSSSKIIVIVATSCNTQAALRDAFVTVKRGSTNLGDSSLGMTRIKGHGGRIEVPVNISFVDSPSTTSSVTYTVQVRSHAGGEIEIPATNTGEKGSIMFLEVAS